MLNGMLNSSETWRKYFVSKFGERAALSLTNDITSRVSYLKLGMLNLSSALLNLSQLVNAAGYLGGWNRLLKHFGSVAKRRGKLTFKELRILTESGVLNDIGLDTASAPLFVCQTKSPYSHQAKVCYETLCPLSIKFCNPQVKDFENSVIVGKSTSFCNFAKNVQIQF